MTLLERVSRYADGARILSDWIGDGGKPASREIAEARAEVCNNCPMNDSGWKAPEHVATAIKEQLVVKNGLHLSTKHDDNLHTCKVCLCPLKLKVYTPLSYQTRYMKSDEIKAFPEHCWLRKEMNL